MAQGCKTLREAAAVQIDSSCIVDEVVPAIHRDCGGDGGMIWTASSSIGAFNALAAICRHPEIFQTAICKAAPTT